MTKKIFTIFVIYLLLAYSLSIEVYAEPKSPYPEDGKKEEQEKWVLENPNLFSPDSPSQREAFKRVYKNKKFDYSNPNHLETIKKYVATFKDGIPNTDTDRTIASEYISKYMNKNANLREGNIKIVIELRTYIVDRDGIRHDIDEFRKIADLIGIKSKPDGTIELITKDKGAINLRGTSVIMNQNGEFVISNGRAISLESNQGKTITIENDRGDLKVTCNKGCVLSKGYAVIALQEGGSFKDLGNNRFSIEDGVTRLGQNLLSGKYVFSLNIAKDGHTTFNFGEDVRLLKYQRGNNWKNSFIHLEDTHVNDGKLHFGVVDISTGIGPTGRDSTVIACFDCKDKSKLETYDGYVNFEKFENNNCNSASCERVYRAKVKGLVAARFENDAFHEGFDKNLLVSYYPNGKDTKDIGMGLFTLESCKGCKIGHKEIVGIQTLNNNFFQIRNDYYSSEKQDPKLRYEHIRLASIAVPYIHYAKFNKEGINFLDSDVYNPSKGQDTLNTGVYKSNTLRAESSGGKSVKNYLSEYYNKEFLKNPSEANRQIANILSEITNQKYSRNLYVIDNTAFNYDKNGKRVNVQNVYATTKDGNVFVDQLQAVESGIYANFFQRQSTKDIIDILNKKGLTGKERQDEFERLYALKSDEIFFKTRMQFLSSVIDGGRVIKEETPVLFRFLRELLQAFPKDEAEKRIGDYTLKYEGAKKIFEMRSNGISLDEIYRTSGSSPEIKAAFQEPFLVHRLNQEIIVRASPEQNVNIYYLENGELKTKSVDIGNANRVSSLDTARAYTKDSFTHFSDTRLAVDILSAQITSELTSEKDREILQKYVQNLIQANKLHPNSRYQEGIIYFTKAGLAESNYIKIGEDRYFVASSEIIQMIKDGKLDFNEIRELSEINQIYQQDARAKQLKYYADIIIPRNMPEVALNVVPEFSTLQKGLLAAWGARTFVTATKTYGGLIGNVGLATFLGGTVRRTEANLISKRIVNEFKGKEEIARGLERSLIKDTKTSLATQHLNRPPWDIELSTGEIIQYEPHNAIQDLRLQASAKSFGVEVSSGINIEMFALGDAVAVTERGYERIPRRGEVIVYKDDYLDRRITDGVETYFRTTNRRFFEDIRKNIDGVDLEKSFGISGSFKSLPPEVQTDIENKMRKATIFRTTKGHEILEQGVEQGGIEIWLKETWRGEVTGQGKGIIETVATDRKVNTQSSEFAAFSRVDLERTLGLKKDWDGLGYEEKLDVIHRLENAQRHSSPKSTLAFSNAGTFPTRAHVHPFRFGTGDVPLDRQLNALVTDPYHPKFGESDIERLSAIKESALPELRRYFSIYDSLAQEEQALLRHLETSSDSISILMKEREKLAIEALESKDPIRITVVSETLHRDGILPKKETLVDPHARLEQFVMDKDNLDLSQASIKNFRENTGASVKHYEILKNRIGFLIEGYETKVPDSELLSRAIDYWIMTPSPGDVHSVLTRKGITLPSGTNVKIEKIVYPNGGIVYAVYEDGTDTINIMRLIDNKWETTKMPLSDFVEIEKAGAKSVEGISNIGKSENLGVKVIQTKEFTVTEVKQLFEREGLQKPGSDVLDDVLNNVVMMFNEKQVDPKYLPDIAVMFKRDVGGADALVLNVVEGRIRPEEFAEFLEMAKQFKSVNTLYHRIRTGEISKETVRALSQVVDIKSIGDQPLAILGMGLERHVISVNHVQTFVTESKNLDPASMQFLAIYFSQGKLNIDDAKIIIKKIEVLPEGQRFLAVLKEIESKK